MRNLGESNTKQKNVPTMNPDLNEASLKKEIQRLSKELEYAKLKLLGLETMIQEAEKHLQIKIKKSMVPNSQKVKAAASQTKLGGAMPTVWSDETSLL